MNVRITHPEKPGSMTCPIGAYERLWSKRGWVIASETPAPRRRLDRGRLAERLALLVLVVHEALSLLT